MINPREAALVDAAAGIHVRFRLGGSTFPPLVFYKIFTHRCGARASHPAAHRCSCGVWECSPAAHGRKHQELLLLMGARALIVVIGRAWVWAGCGPLYLLWASD